MNNMSKIPFLVLCVPQKNKGAKIFKEMDLRSEAFWEQNTVSFEDTPLEMRMTRCENKPVEVRDFFLSDYAHEFHKFVASFGFDLRYEFTHEQWGKVHKRIKLMSDDVEVNEVAGFNLHMSELAAEMIGKMGNFILHRKLSENLKLKVVNEVPGPERPKATVHKI